MKSSLVEIVYSPRVLRLWSGVETGLARFAPPCPQAADSECRAVYFRLLPRLRAHGSPRQA